MSSIYETALTIAGCFVLVSLVLSTMLISQHLRYYTNPAEQKCIVAVLFMVPVYAVESILSLWSSKLSLACDILRNCYEAFALYSFGSYLIACLGGERKVVEVLEEESKEIRKPLLEGQEKPELHRSSLWNFIRKPRVLGKDLLTIEKFGLVQYMILKTLCAFLTLVLELCGVYGDGEFKWRNGYPYITVVINFSQMWALYCLVQFYNVTHERLKAIKPLAKFISFKAIVFATWWQGVGIALLCYFRVLPNAGLVQTGLQDFLICIEMAIAAIAHIFVFSAKPYHFMPVSEYGKIRSEKTEALLKMEEGNNEENSATVEKTENTVEAPGTSVTESVQDIVVVGGQKVVKDVVLTINQAIEPVEKGVTKIQEKMQQHISVSSSGKEKAGGEMKIEEHKRKATDNVEKEVSEEVKIEEHKRKASDNVEKEVSEEVKIEEHKRKVSDNDEKGVSEEVKIEEHKRKVSDNDEKGVSEEVKIKEHKRKVSLNSSSVEEEEEHQAKIEEHEKDVVRDGSEVVISAEDRVVSSTDDEFQG